MYNDFTSIDKLVEFGLGIGIATQMMNTMNHVMAQTAIPGVGINPGTTPRQTAQRQCAPTCAGYYIVHNDSTAGPFSAQELQTLVANGVVTQESFVWHPGMAGWNRAIAIPEVNKLLILNNIK